MHTEINSATTIGVTAHPVNIEVDLAHGILQCNIVGLPDTAIKESRQRITTALKNSGFRLPDRKITINLAPADLRKEGTLFDLPIALGIVIASGKLAIDTNTLAKTVVLGELSLAGYAKWVKGILPIAYDMAQSGFQRIIVPKNNAHEAALVPEIEVIGISTLIELISYLRGESHITPAHHASLPYSSNNTHDFRDVHGQQQAKRTLQIAAAGHHNIMLIGSPGSGKTMLAKRLTSIMPPMSFDETIATSKVYSISGKLIHTPVVQDRPFRDPHHTTSQAGLIGGGSTPQPGEISLAHNGILFLDELTEFKRSTLEVLRQPLESGVISVSRAQYAAEFPAHILLVAAMNPCPCGYYGDNRHACTCSPQQLRKYHEKLSGPLIDRIDLQVHVPAVAYADTKSHQPPTSSEDLYHDIKVALQRQEHRFNDTTMRNAYMQSHHIDNMCYVSSEADHLIHKAFDRLGLTMRGYHTVLKVARTIADLANRDTIEAHHIQEALMYRMQHNQDM